MRLKSEIMISGFEAEFSQLIGPYKQRQKQSTRQVSAQDIAGPVGTQINPGKCHKQVNEDEKY